MLLDSNLSTEYYVVSQGVYWINSSYDDSEYTYCELQSYDNNQYSLVQAIRVCQMKGFYFGSFNGLNIIKIKIKLDLRIITNL